MKKILKNIVSYVLVISLLMCSFIVPDYRVEAKTVNDLNNELQKYIDDYNAKQNKINLTKEQKQQVEASIAANNRTIVNIGIDIQNLNQEIEKLNGDIEKMDNEIKQIMNYIEISSGESEYLEYIFGATSFSDFIYRATIAEQLSKYNNDLIKEYNNDIKENEQKTKELAQKRIDLSNAQVELAANREKLGQEVNNLEEEVLDVSAEIKARKDYINMLKNTYKCKDNDDIDKCTANILPPDTKLWRPLMIGEVTANFGPYTPYGPTPVLSHYGMDLAGPDGSSVYSAANGVVVATIYQPDYACGRNIVYIIHNINGVRYTTGYWHLRAIKVNLGQAVTKDTVIGIQGGSKADHDGCSTGAHLHFMVATGEYMKDYKTQKELNARRIDPRSTGINLPPLIPFKGYINVGYSIQWQNRTTRY